MRTKRKPQSVYQYEPLVTPSNWSGEEKQFVVRLTQLFDQLFARKTGPSGAVEPGTPGEPGKDGEDGVGISSVAQTTTSTADGGENVITVTLTDGSENRFSVRNGSKGSPGDKGDSPVRGVDYWTEADKEEIVSEVVEEVGTGTGGSVNEIATLTAEEYEALTTEEKAAMYAQGVRVIAVESAFDADSLTDMQRFAAFAHPVGKVVDFTVATNPATMWGFGTWESFMPGRVLVGAGTDDSGTVYEAGQTGGIARTNHVSYLPPINSNSSQNAGNLYRSAFIERAVDYLQSGGLVSAETSIVVENVGGSIGNNNGTATELGQLNYVMDNMQPYGVVYRWLRTA